MIKQQLYPKTKRVSQKSDNSIIITEKLDGSNLCIFKDNGVVCFAQRNNIYPITEIDDIDIIYKGLKDWVKKNKEFLEDIHEGSVICGEWLGMGRIFYGDAMNHKFYMFAKANFEKQDDRYVLKNINYYHELFKWCFDSQELPNCIRVVPVVKITKEIPTIDMLNELYEDYSKCTSTKIEGFVVNRGNDIRKYVRFKDGKLTDHKE